MIFNPHARVSVDSYPYDHVVIEDTFSDDLAEELTDCFARSITHAKPIGKVGEVGELHYSALNYTPDLVDIRTSAITHLISQSLRDFVSGLFGISANQYVMLGSHRHLPPSKNGWPHTDCTVVSFPRQNPVFDGCELFQPDSGCVYADDSSDRQPESIKMSRAIACLYYVGIRDWSSGDGGETAIYAADKTTIVKKIPPTHNSLFAFDISPDSLHGFLGSKTLIRDSFIWWYHAPIETVVTRHQASFDRKLAVRQDPWDRWTDVSVPKYPTVDTPDRVN